MPEVWQLSGGRKFVVTTSSGAGGRPRVDSVVGKYVNTQLTNAVPLVRIGHLLVPFHLASGNKAAKPTGYHVALPLNNAEAQRVRSALNAKSVPAVYLPKGMPRL